MTKNKTIFSIIAAFVVGVILTMAFYAYQQRADVDAGKLLIEKVTQGNVTVLSNFNSLGDLEGYVVQSTGANPQQGVIYTDRQANYLISGVVIDTNGNNVNQADFEKYVAPVAVNNAYSNLGNATWVEQGSPQAPHKAYIMIDPNCIYCHQVYLALQPQIAAGKLAVRWIPVGFLKASSAGKVYAILGAQNPSQALQKNEQNFNNSIEEGGITPVKNPSAAIKDQFNKNMQFMVQSQLTVTPVILYKNTSGNPKISMGMPDPAKLNTLISKMGANY
ncbi:MAG: thiol:disulfide interchange protein DsbG [Gammaproteobacteria bacterium]|nr:thiol:disulfide interchange protein DsbG [Gammaproteobacteria bacterium]